MLNLIVKDIMIQRKTIPLAMFYVVFFIFCTNNAWNKGSIYIIGVTLAYIFSLGSIQYDERYKADNIIASLPLTRLEIVISRYLGMILFTTVSTIFIILLAIILRASNIMPGIESISLQDIKTIFVLTLVLMSIVIPINFKLGMKKTKIVNILLYLTFFFTILNFYQISVERNNYPWMFTYFTSYSVILSIFMLVISFSFSVYIFTKKDIV